MAKVFAGVRGIGPVPVLCLTAMTLGVLCLEADAQTGEWVWMSGTSTVVEQFGVLPTCPQCGVFVGMPGVYGTLGTPAAGNVPGGRQLAVGWSDKRGNLWLFGGSGLDSTSTATGGQLNDLWEFNPSTREWAWMGGSSTLIDEGGGFRGTPGVYGTLGTAGSGNVPGGRYSATSWTDSSGNFWLFGGQGFDSTATNGTVNNLGYLNDLWEFNPSAREWARMGGNSTVGCYYCGPPGVYGTLGTPAPGNAPGGRSDASSWTDHSGNLWLFGGIGVDSTAPPYGGGGLLNDLWEFNPSTREWAWMGGSSGSSTFSGVYGTLGTPAPGNAPGGRSDANTWTDGRGNLWLFGGMGLDSTGTAGYLNDLWGFNPSTREWAWMGGSSKVGQPGVYGILGTPAAVNVPGGRERASSWTNSSGNFWLFGGDTGSAQGAVFNDLWEFNPPTQEWAWMSGSSTIDLAGVYGTLGIPAAGNIPGGRSAANTWTDSRGNLWLFGGYGADSSGTLTRLNDLWEYQSSPSPADFQLSLNQPALTIIAGQSGTVTLTVTPENGFNSQVSFACSGLPSEVTCRFSPTFVTPSSSAPTSTLTVATNAANAATRVSIPFSQPPIYVLLFPVLAMIFGVAPRRRRALHGLRLVGLLILLMLDLGVTSCGGDGGNPGPPIGTYTVSVSASTNGAGAIDHTATLSITITQ